MMLIEQSAVSSAVLPLAEFRTHLRLGTGFPDDGGQDALLESVLRAALATVEKRTSKAILSRSFRWTVSAWRGLSQEILPVAPVSAISALRIVDADGTDATIAPDRYGLIADAHRPCLAARSATLPTIPIGGSAEVDFDAGYAAAWTGVPQDLARGVLMLAAHYHEHRHAVGVKEQEVPEGVAALIAPYRNLRLFGGRG